MKCPFCSDKDLKVTDSREAPEMNAIRRRRECQHCSKRFTTFETVELTIQVQKRDGHFEDFQQQKLVNGILAACRHTSISHNQVITLAAQITGEIIQSHSRTISTTALGDMVMQRLLSLDPIAYIRFACVYQRFKKMDELMEAIALIQSKDDKCMREAECH